MRLLFFCKQILRVMADEPDLIPGIYIYCDRWCDRCAFTSRCLQFRIEAEERDSGDALPDFDALNVQFWHEMGEALLKTVRLIREIAIQEGIDPDDLQHEPASSEPSESLLRDAREHPCAHAALLYVGMVNDWFPVVDEGSDAEEESSPTHASRSLEEPMQVIRYYQYFIYPKIVRAVEGRLSQQVSVHAQSDTDACGTAKVALIAIDRSLAAWSLMYEEFPLHQDRIISILLHLDRLRRAVEVIFPEARAFIRPGLDG